MRAFRAINSSVKSSLNSIRPGYGEIYMKRLLSTSERGHISFVEIKKMLQDDELTFQVLRDKFSSSPENKKLFQSEILQVLHEDIELTEDDKVGKIMLIAKNDLEILYGEKGKVASEEVSPLKMLTKKYVVPGGSFGVLSIDKHVPFQIKNPNKENEAFVVLCKLKNFPDLKSNINNYSFEVLDEMGFDIAKEMNVRIRDRIFGDPHNESFYEETTSKVYAPNDHVRSSGTLMNFEQKSDVDSATTSAHYHPGKRSLLIFTTEKEAGVTLNFCGTEESPEDRKDCEVRKDFPRNSFLALTFPSYTHHKFHGEFVCLSIHPRDGQNIINAVKTGTLPKGFLESATVFSKTKNEANEWGVSGSGGEQKKQDRSR